MATALHPKLAVSQARRALSLDLELSDLPQPRLRRTARHLSILAVCLPVLLVLWAPVGAAIRLSLNDDRYLQILLAPALCAFLVYWNRAEIFKAERYAPRAGFSLLAPALLLCGVLAYRWSPADGTAGLLPVAVAVVLAWMAGFVLCYGTQSFRTAIYPLCCLFLILPLPPATMDKVTEMFQHGSAATSYFILELIGIPVFRQDMVFSLPGLDFRVAPECSGIRSFLAFFMVAILAGRLYLGSGWSRLALVAATVPIAICKNAIRIVTIVSLGAYVDRSFIDGPFHHQYGGLIFGWLDLVLFLPILSVLQRLERRRSRNAAKSGLLPAQGLFGRPLTEQPAGADRK